MAKERWYAILFGSMGRKEECYGPERLIAAHAHGRSLTLVTNAACDFGGYPGLVVKNWAHPDAD